MQIMELNNAIHPINMVNPNNINNMDISNNFNKNVNEIKTPSSENNLIFPINKDNIDSGNCMVSSAPEINTLLALKRIKKIKEQK